ncbi:MurR/RpiR family transcriptional regulator [Enterococcus durans]|uniref:MurR/RpiR family transcriptional regulator n=2 Tax=Enterococcus durans TaxID=53345 RepID=UPI002331214A|nr:MurR/RpiR family transcriptional regulator [Enterococcus durans]MDB1652947.1 MurR/RpiR family transcriptional regulator [Enterococcus durans]MDB1656340.1 MurR/RpiR family transcriptional regulator [Enterococcus durans]MDB1663317.1 MurR/RpiR family transcriptional regulator [Enterococcus durans]MDB1667759.1 MurR/RpiR family transcriptional regulator [Enterococcus durans]MDB1671075.1 MurR/RpiR family transcriptional regulator [Enterococcus durans]
MLIEDKLIRQDTFTTTEKRIADYLQANFEAAVYMTIEKLAKATYTSHSAIIRLCKKLGFTGFKEFRLELGREVHQLLAQFDQTIDANFPFSEQDDGATIAKKMAELSIQAVKKAQLQIEDQPLDTIAEKLTQAKRIFVFAKGDSQITARKFQNKLVKLNKFLILAEEYSDSSWNAANLTKEDCAVFISYSGRIHHYEKIMSYLKYVGTPTLLLTGNEHSEMAKKASMCLVISQGELDFVKVATFSSQIAFDYVLNTLYSIMYAQNYTANVLNLKEKQQLIQNGLLKEYRQ